MNALDDLVGNVVVRDVAPPDEHVARLQLSKLGVELTQLSDEQAAYIGVKKEGPYKPDSYRY